VSGLVGMISALSAKTKPAALTLVMAMHNKRKANKRIGLLGGREN